jgi:tetratricopeptide (TPR) repeat protein
MSLGDMVIGQEQWADAVHYYEQAVALARQIGARLSLANILIDLGRARFELGDREAGIRDVQEALNVYIAIDDPRWAGIARERLADLLDRAERSAEAQALRAQLPPPEAS